MTSENHPVYGSTPPEVVEAILDGTYEPQPGLKDAVETGAVAASQVSTTPAAPAATPQDTPPSS